MATDSELVSWSRALEVAPLTPLNHPANSHREGTLMQTPKRLLLHVDDNPACAPHAILAERLAARFDAQVTAMYAVTPTVLRYPVASIEGAWPVAGYMAEIDEQQLAATKERMLAVIKNLPRVRWHAPRHLTSWNFASQALLADLVLMHPSSGGQAETPVGFAASVAIESGRPVLLLPTQPPADVGRRILVAWKPAADAMHALTAALPWLRVAERVHLVVEAPDGAAADTADAPSIDDYLTAHGIAYTKCMPLPRQRDVAPALQSLARETDADLVVMGCYGHSRAREWILGGTTRAMLRDPTLPVLLAH